MRPLLKGLKAYGDKIDNAVLRNLDGFLDRENMHPFSLRRSILFIGTMLFISHTSQEFGHAINPFKSSNTSGVEWLVGAGLEIAGVGLYGRHLQKKSQRQQEEKKRLIAYQRSPHSKDVDYVTFDDGKTWANVKRRSEKEVNR